MQRYIIRRLLLMIPTIFGISVLIFAMVRLVPGDIVTLMSGDYGAVPDNVREAILRDFGLDRNWVVQYISWASDILRLDLGTSLISGRSVGGDMAARLPVTFELGLLAILVSTAIALPIGIISAIRQESTADYVGRSFAIGLIAAPNFWVAIILFTLAGRYFTWGVPPVTYVPFTEDPIGNLKMMAVPAFILGGGLSGVVMRFTRSAMLEVLRQDYVRTAHSKGLTERAVIVRHALKNALIPVVTVIGGQIPLVIGGTVVVETVYSLPGVARLYFTAINTLDFPVIQGIVLLTSIVVVLSNLLVDLTYSVLDPRIRYA